MLRLPYECRLVRQEEGKGGQGGVHQGPEAGKLSAVSVVAHLTVEPLVERSNGSQGAPRGSLGKSWCPRGGLASAPVKGNRNLCDPLPMASGEEPGHRQLHPQPQGQGSNEPDLYCNGPGVGVRGGGHQGEPQDQWAPA